MCEEGWVTSLRARLAIWHVALLACVFGLFAVGLYLDVRKAMIDGIDTAMQAQAASVLSNVVITAHGLSYRGGLAPHANTTLAVYLFDTQGHLLYRIIGSTSCPPTRTHHDTWREKGDRRQHEQAARAS